MDDIEREYRSRLGRLSGRERVSLSAGLLAEICEMIRHRIHDSEPELPEREIRRRIAVAIYRTDRGARQLLSILAR
jgi:hypothetical protein